MEQRCEYAVLRFVDKNGYCHMIHDYVEGTSLAQYLKVHPKTDKTIFFGWLAKIGALAVQFYKWKDGECFGYFNPYAIVLTEEGPVFLDTKDEENEELIGLMQKKSVRSFFMRPERVLSLKITFDDDMYSLGKTIQFLAAKCVTVPGFTRKEERSLRRVISKCTDKREKELKDLKEIHRELKKLSDKEVKIPEKGHNRRRILGAAAFLIIVAVIVVSARGGNKAPTARAGDKNGAARTLEIEEVTVSGQKKEVKENEHIHTQLELGLLYLTELEDEEQSLACFEEAAAYSELAEIYLKIIHYIGREKNGTYAGRELEQALQKGTEELEKVKAEEWWEQKQVLYQIPFLRAYGLLNTKSSAEAAIYTCAELLESDAWKSRDRGKKHELEVRTYLAGAFETAGEDERAIEEYETVKELEEEPAALEQIYAKLEGLYERAGQKENVWQILKEGTEKMPQSEQIWVRYLKQCCADNEIEREVCAEYVKNALSMLPDIKDNVEFQKLQKEYEITVEGENVCVGR